MRFELVDFIKPDGFTQNKLHFVDVYISVIAYEFVFACNFQFDEKPSSSAISELTESLRKRVNTHSMHVADATSNGILGSLINVRRFDDSLSYMCFKRGINTHWPAQMRYVFFIIWTGESFSILAIAIGGIFSGFKWNFIVQLKT